MKKAVRNRFRTAFLNLLKLPEMEYLSKNGFEYPGRSPA